MRKCIVLCFFLCAYSFAVNAQFSCPTFPRVAEPEKGDSMRAARTQHWQRNSNNNGPVAYLGYIAADSATKREIIDNLEVGLTASPENYTVISFAFSILPKGEDLKGAYNLQGNKVPKYLSTNTLRIYDIAKGDRVIFNDIKVRKTGSSAVIRVKPVDIRVY